MGTWSSRLRERRSINEVICHGIPDQRKLQEGDIINIGTSLTAILARATRSPGPLDVIDVSVYYDGKGRLEPKARR